MERNRATCKGEDHRWEGERFVGREGQLKRWVVVSGEVEQRGQRGEGATLMRWRYDWSLEQKPERSWERVVR